MALLPLVSINSLNLAILPFTEHEDTVCFKGELEGNPIVFKTIQQASDGGKPSDLAIRKCRDAALVYSTLYDPSIHVNILARVDQPDACGVVFEYHDTSLLSWLRTPHTHQELVLTARDIAVAVNTLHSRRSCHLNLHPNNVFITHHGLIRLGDPQVANALWSDPASTSSSSSSSSPLSSIDRKVARFLACPPEGLGSGPSADIYALGMLIWLIFYGHSPNASKFLQELQKKQDSAGGVDGKEWTPPLPSHFHHPAVGDFHQTLSSCWHPEPSVRPSAMQIALALSRYLQASSVLAPRFPCISRSTLPDSRHFDRLMRTAQTYKPSDEATWSDATHASSASWFPTSSSSSSSSSTSSSSLYIPPAASKPRTSSSIIRRDSTGRHPTSAAAAPMVEESPTIVTYYSPPVVGASSSSSSSAAAPSPGPSSSSSSTSPAAAAAALAAGGRTSIGTFTSSIASAASSSSSSSASSSSSPAPAAATSSSAPSSSSSSSSVMLPSNALGIVSEHPQLPTPPPRKRTRTPKRAQIDLTGDPNAVAGDSPAVPPKKRVRKRASEIGEMKDGDGNPVERKKRGRKTKAETEARDLRSACLSWSPVQVAIFLTNLGMGHLSKYMINSSISGPILLNGTSELFRTIGIDSTSDLAQLATAVRILQGVPESTATVAPATTATSASASAATPTPSAAASTAAAQTATTGTPASSPTQPGITIGTVVEPVAAAAATSSTPPAASSSSSSSSSSSTSSTSESGDSDDVPPPAIPVASVAERDRTSSSSSQTASDEGVPSLSSPAKDQVLLSASSVFTPPVRQADLSASSSSSSSSSALGAAEAMADDDDDNVYIPPSARSATTSSTPATSTSSTDAAGTAESTPTPATSSATTTSAVPTASSPSSASSASSSSTLVAVAQLAAAHIPPTTSTTTTTTTTTSTMHHPTTTTTTTIDTSSIDPTASSTSAATSAAPFIPTTHAPTHAIVTTMASVVPPQLFYPVNVAVPAAPPIPSSISTAIVSGPPLFAHPSAGYPPMYHQTHLAHQHQQRQQHQQ